MASAEDGGGDERLIRDIPGDGSTHWEPLEGHEVGEGCLWQEFWLKPERGSVPNVLLVVDHSASMNDENRWPTMTAALRQLTGNLEEVIDFGLILFPPPNVDLYSQCATGQLIVALGPSNADEISSHLNSTPFGGTPTAMTLYEARDILMNTGSDPPGYVLLATDGGPGCNANLNPYTCECLGDDCTLNVENCVDDLRTLQAVDALYENGIRTFVVGIPGTEPFGELLDAMAIRGGTDVDHHHYAVSDGPQLEAALADATGSVAPCIYELDEMPVDQDGVIIRIDGEDVPRDEGHSHGWDFDDPRTIHFYGASCGQLRDGAPHDISASYEWCP
ncbi:MAG: VWA domain-containing protein [Bradymonadales bacterium]|nr:VWA domain-containing protein [Bradymonadales bacterium]